jgi:hypothetical protein
MNKARGFERFFRDFVSVFYTYIVNRQTKEAVALLEHVVKVKETMLAEMHADRRVSERPGVATHALDRKVENSGTM